MFHQLAQRLTLWLPVSALGYLGAKSFDFRGIYSRNVPARNRTMSLLFKAGPDSLSSAWCAKPFPWERARLFFLPSSQVSVPWQFYRGLNSLFNWDRNSESFLNSFGNREVDRKAIVPSLRFVWTELVRLDIFSHILSRWLCGLKVKKKNGEGLDAGAIMDQEERNNKAKEKELGFSVDHQDGRKVRQILELSLKLFQTTGYCAWGRGREGIVMQFHPQSCKGKLLDKGIVLDILQLEPSRAFDTSYKILPSLQNCLACLG